MFSSRLILNIIDEEVKNIESNKKLVEAYYNVLKNMNKKDKLSLISKLNKSVKSHSRSRVNRFKRSFGAWVGKESAEEIIQSIRGSRHFNRRREEL